MIRNSDPETKDERRETNKDKGKIALHGGRGEVGRGQVASCNPLSTQLVSLFFLFLSLTLSSHFCFYFFFLLFLILSSHFFIPNSFSSHFCFYLFFVIPDSLFPILFLFIFYSSFWDRFFPSHFGSCFVCLFIVIFWFYKKKSVYIFVCFFVIFPFLFPTSFFPITCFLDFIMLLFIHLNVFSCFLFSLL